MLEPDQSASIPSELILEISDACCLTPRTANRLLSVLTDRENEIGEDRHHLAAAIDDPPRNKRQIGQECASRNQSNFIDVWVTVALS